VRIVGVPRNCQYCVQLRIIVPSIVPLVSDTSQSQVSHGRNVQYENLRTLDGTSICNLKFNLNMTRESVRYILLLLRSFFRINLLKPTGHVMHQQFNIQQLYVLPTLYLCVLYLSENKQRLVPLTP
jgi:hypothetical protein